MSFFAENFFAIIVASIISELLISKSWSKIYFTNILRVPLKNLTLNEKQLERLRTLDDYDFKNGMEPTILMKKLSDNQIAIREKIFDFSAISYSAIIHGFLQIDSDYKEVKVYGVFNYTMILFVVFLISQLWDQTDLVFTFIVMLFPILLLTAIFIAQRKIYLEAVSSILKHA